MGDIPKRALFFVSAECLPIRALAHIPNTLGLACAGARVVTVTDLAQLPALSRLWVKERTPPLVLGAASNLILPPRMERLLVLPRFPGIRLLEVRADAWLVEAMAGQVWHGLVEQTLAHGWEGLENLALIPGTVGAAPVQNIGAYGVELRERLHSVLAWQVHDGALQELSLEQCQFAYRDSRFKREAGWVIVAVRLRLPRPWQPVLTYPDVRAHLQDAQNPSARAVFDAVCTIRRAKLPDPAQLGNVGSYFKNPIIEAAQALRLRAQFPGLPAWQQGQGRVKLAAGSLIEQAGWKGRRLGSVGMHARQALVLVNHGGARFADVMALEDAVRRDVYARFGITLEREPDAVQ